MSLDWLPNELVSHLLYFVRPADILDSVSRVSRRYHQLSAENVLWRYHCSQIRYWETAHDYRGKLQLPPLDVDWRRLYILHHGRRRQAEKHFDDVLGSMVSRLVNQEHVCRIGYDAKDFLLEQAEADIFAGDGLARRYFAGAILDSIHRAVGVSVWAELSQMSTSSFFIPRFHPQGGTYLERWFAAFDMFVLYGQPGDIQETVESLDGVAVRFRLENPEYETRSHEERALMLTSWLRDQGLIGMQEPSINYRNLRNCFIGQALRNQTKHDSIPLVSTVIYSSVAARLGLWAYPLPTEGHMFVLVMWPDDGSLNVQSMEDCEFAIFDPFNCTEEIPYNDRDSMVARYKDILFPGNAFAPQYGAALCERMARNIEASIFNALDDMSDNPPSAASTELLAGTRASNMSMATYATRWAIALLDNAGFFNQDPIVTFDSSSPIHAEDGWIMEKFIDHMHRNRSTRSYSCRRCQEYRTALQQRRIHDARERPQRRRHDGLQKTDQAPSVAQYKIGQVFKHSRFGWDGVITSWGTGSSYQGDGPFIFPDYADAHGGYNMPNREGIFYSALRAGSEENHFVHEMNIDIVPRADESLADQFPAAGRFFKRFDRDTGTFVSNVREVYPDD